jgi:type VI secretion system secreted protein Hcp
MTHDGDGRQSARGNSRHLRRFAKLVLPTGAALGAGAAIAAGAPGQDSGVGTAGTPANSPAVFARAPSSYYLELSGIKGESTADKDSNAIDVDSFAFGDEASMTRFGASGAGAGRVHFDDLTIKKNIDSSSPQLFQDSASGQHIQKAVLIAVKDGASAQEYLKITLSNVVVSSYHVESQEPAGNGEVETITLDYQQINYQYESQSPDGSSSVPSTVGWNVSENKAS